MKHDVVNASNQRELILSVTSKNFRIETVRGSGKGGQNRNKRDTCVRITHFPSGAVAYACDERKQGVNKRLAFRRLVETKEFKLWLQIQVGKQEIPPHPRQSTKWVTGKMENGRELAPNVSHRAT